MNCSSKVKLFAFFLFAVISASLLDIHAAAKVDRPIVVAVPNGVNSLDPLKANIVQEYYILPLIFEYLFRYDSSNDIVPELVETFDFDAKKSILKIKIKKDHVFSDGKPVKANDVVETISRFCSSPLGNSRILFGLKGCGAPNKDLGVKFIGEHEIQFEITVPPSMFILELTAPQLAIHKRKQNNDLVGSGPYRLSFFSRENINLERNYFDKIRREKVIPAFFTIKYIPDRDASIALTNRQVDIASMYLSFSLVPHLKNPEYQILQSAPHVSQILVLNPNVYPFSNEKLRKAIQTAVYHSTISDCGAGRIKAKGLIPTGIGGNLDVSESPKGIRYQADINSLILPKPLKIKIYRHKDRKDSCEETKLASVFKFFNIELDFKYPDNYRDLDKICVDPSTAAYIELFAFSNRDASKFLSRFTPMTHEPFFFYTSDKIANLLNQASELSNIRHRFPIYKKINEMIEEKGSAIPLYYVGHTMTVRTCLLLQSTEHIDMNPNSFLFLLKGEILSKCQEL